METFSVLISLSDVAVHRARISCVVSADTLARIGEDWRVLFPSTASKSIWTFNLILEECALENRVLRQQLSVLALEDSARGDQVQEM
jgi:DNA-binding HxlR family transcriptional regulator